MATSAKPDGRISKHVLLLLLSSHLLLQRLQLLRRLHILWWLHQLLLMLRWRRWLLRWLLLRWRRLLLRRRGLLLLLH